MTTARSSGLRAMAWRLAVTLLFASACVASKRDDESAWIHVAVNGLEPGDIFQATVARGDSAPGTLVCPEPEVTPDAVRCAPGGFDVLAGDGAIDVVVRARGKAFASLQIASERAAAVTLTPLESSSHTADYATGFDGDDCLSELQKLAIPLATEVGTSYSVKFYVAGLKDEPRVYFQNTQRHPLHYDFAATVLGIARTATEFALETYTGTDREGLAGTLVYYPAVLGAQNSDGERVDAPWTLSFFSSDDITPEQVRVAHRLVEERLTCLSWRGRTQRLVYLPAGSLQEQQAREDSRAFARQGIAWIDHGALFEGISRQALNPGVAFGTLRRMTPEELAQSVVSFRDVLLLTRLPNQLPIVGGTITEEFQTPLSHVNVAARTRGTPNLAYPGAFQDPSVAQLIGKLVRFAVADGDFSIREATSAEAEESWQARSPDRYVPEFDSSFTGVPAFDEVEFSDSIRVGVKAANLAELSRILGENAPQRGLAIPFHYYQAHLDHSLTSRELCDEASSSCMSSGRDREACREARDLCWPDGAVAENLTAHIERVLVDPGFREDTAVRDAALADLRYLIEHSALDPEFADLLDRRVAEVFGNARVKLRSSTNCEDLPNFSGAGLYESYGARANDQDSPSRVVPKVFASAWTFRGFEERSYWNIDQSAVRMGCAINEAFSNELANGVLITANIADPGVEGMYVNVQRGEEEVTNPTNGALPEIFSLIAAPGGVQLARQRFSSLSPATPLLSQSEIESLYQTAAKTQAHFASLYDLPPGQLILDIEFKLTSERKIVFKQARPYSLAPSR
jgi:pyruvate,water dikinase